MDNKNTVNMASFRRNPEFYFKVGLRYVRKKMFEQALKNFNRAVDIEPFNADYKFNLACVLSELKDNSNSNDILMDILMNIDPKLTECYFGIGCNYFDMGDFKKAREYFEKYVYFDREGQLAEEACDILQYLEIYEDVGNTPERDKEIEELLSQGRRLLNKGDYDKACQKLEKVIELNPELAEARNDLSNAYCMKGKLDKAISMAKSVLILDNGNITANCNLLLFYAQAGKKGLHAKQLEVLSKLKTGNIDELKIVVHTFSKLGKHDVIVRLLMDYLGETRDYELLQMLATAFYNMLQYEEAEQVWCAVEEFYPQYNLVTDYYIKICRDASNGRIEHNEMQYTAVLPKRLENEYRKLLSEYMKLEHAMFAKLWQKDSKLRNIVLYYLYTGRKQIKRSIIDKMSTLKNATAKEALKLALDGQCDRKPPKLPDIEPIKIRNHGAGLAGQSSKSSSAEVKPDSRQPLWRKEWDGVISCAVQNRESVYKAGYESELKGIWMNFISRVYPESMPVIRKSEAWAAALEYVYCSLHLIRVTKRKLAEKYNITTASITSRL